MNFISLFYKRKKKFVSLNYNNCSFFYNMLPKLNLNASSFWSLCNCVCLFFCGKTLTLATTFDLLCLDHIKIYDRAIQILSVGRPIYQVWLSQIGRWRAFTLKICTADHSWELVCFSSVGHRPFIARQSGTYRPMIGRPVTDKYIYVPAYYITMLAYHTEMSYLMPLEKQVFTPGTITRTKFIVVKWRNINVIVRVRSRHVQLL